MTRYYLDTTALFERFTGDESAREEVRRRLRGGKHATSTHVLREWIRLVEGTSAEVLNAMAKGEDDLGEVFARLSQGWGRETGQRLRVLSMLARGKRNVSAAELRARAQQIIRSGSREMFNHYLDDVRDGCECGLARLKVEARRERLVLVDRCKRTDKICRQDDFIAERVDEWRAASRGLVEHSDRDSDRRMGKLGLAIAEDASKGKGKNCYGRTGDISISCECGPEETLLTTDRSFQAIAQDRGIQVTRFNATSPP